jgi:hypothetical protein
MPTIGEEFYFILTGSKLDEADYLIILVRFILAPSEIGL